MNKTEHEAPKRAAIYVRVSQNREGDAAKPERQIARCRMLAEVRGYAVLPHVFLDDDVSAYQGKKERPEYEALLREIEDGEVDVVLTYNTDRMLRTVKEMVRFIEISRKASERHGDWVSIDAALAGSLDLSTPGGRMVAQILAAVAENEVETKSERHKTRNETAIRDGKSLGGPTPFGWQTPEQTAALKWGIRAFIRGESTLSGIAKEWNARGLASTFGKEWKHDSVRKVLKRARNAGLVERAGTDKVMRVVEGATAPQAAVCTEDEWRKVVAMMEGAKRGHRPPAHLLTNLIVCSNGHKMLSGIRSAEVGGKRYSYDVYRCTTCYVNVRREPINAMVRRLVRHRLIFEDVAVLAPSGRDMEKAANLREELGRLRAEFAENESDLSAGLMTRDGFRKAQAVVQGKMAGAQDRLDRIEADNAFAAMLTENVKNVSLTDAAEVGRKFDALPLDQRRMIVSTLFPKIVVERVGRGARIPVEERVKAFTQDGRQYVMSDPDEYEAV